jgi:hypothetical protein
MPRRDPPRYTKNMMADHLRRAHKVASLDLSEVGMRRSARRQCLLRWAESDDPDDLLGIVYGCERCRQHDGEGWDRYYAAVYWAWPLPYHEQAIATHYHDHHPGAGFDPARISSPGAPVSDWQASFIPLAPELPAGFLCAACRPVDAPRLAPRVQIGTPAYGDARRLKALRAARTDLRADLAGRSPLEQAELLEARDRELLLADLHPRTIRAALAAARRRPRDQVTTDYLQLAMINILTDARNRGKQPTPVIEQLAQRAKHPAAFTTVVGRAIPQLAVDYDPRRLGEFRQSVRTLLGTGDAAPTIGERRLWDIWRDHVRDAP